MEHNPDTNAGRTLAIATPLRSELTTEQLEKMVGGFLAFTFKLVAVKTVSWAHD